MIFINTRPVDESVIAAERRASKAVSHCSTHSPEQRKVNMTRLILCLLVFYVLISIFPCLLFTPTSLICLFVPLLLLLYGICKIRGENRSDQWPCIMIAFIGILVKIAAIVVYVMIFPSSHNDRKTSLMMRQSKPEPVNQQYKTAFFVVVVCIEVFVFLVGGCLKWHLVAFEKMEHEAKQRRHTLTSNRPLISEQTSRRPSQA